MAQRELSATMTSKYNLGFIGAGNMAWAIACGVVKAGLYEGRQIIASDILADRRGLFEKKLAAKATQDNDEVFKTADVVVLAIKPQQAKDALPPLAEHVKSEQLIISIMAGVSTVSIEKLLGPQAVVVRVMPNLALSVGAGMTAIVGGSRVTQKHLHLVRQIFQASGQVVEVEEEQMHAVTAVSGSGLAYFFYFVEAIIQAAQKAGLSAEQAELLAKQTCLGAAKTLLVRSEQPAELRRQVTSKGGTTEAALAVMEQAQLKQIISVAILAAARRSQELGP